MRNQSLVPVPAIRARLSTTALRVAILLATALAISACQPAQRPPIRQSTVATEERSRLLSIVGKETQSPLPKPQTPDTTPSVIATDEGQLIASVITVPRHDIDLKTFGRETAMEMQIRGGIEIRTERIDDGMREDATPIYVIEFETSKTTQQENAPQSASAEILPGRQYLLPSPTGEDFVVITCLAWATDAQHCDDFAKAFDLPQTPLADQ